MIKSELLKDNSLIRHYSTDGMKILQNETNILYDEAIDSYPSVCTYTQTDIPVDVEATYEQDF